MECTRPLRSLPLAPGARRARGRANPCRPRRFKIFCGGDRAGTRRDSLGRTRVRHTTEASQGTGPLDWSPVANHPAQRDAAQAPTAPSATPGLGVTWAAPGQRLGTCTFPYGISAPGTKSGHHHSMEFSCSAPGARRSEFYRISCTTEKHPTPGPHAYLIRLR